jgi:tripartite-type tricarboxylate transporter receptor subunit TctC
MRRWLARGAGAALLLSLAAGVAAPVAAQDAFYRGKTITVFVGFAAGAGNDSYTRLLARHIARHIPGTPAVIVENMPGVASARGVMNLELGAPKDGTAIASFSTDLITQSVLGTSASRVDFSKVAWLGSMARDYRVCIAWHATGVRSWQDLVARTQFNIGVTAPGEAAYAYASILKNMFAIPVHIVTGYPGSAEERLAMERGELDGQCGSWSSVPPAWIKDSKVNVLVRFSPDKAADLPDAPYIGDLATRDTDRKALDLLLSVGTLGRPLVLSQSVPADRVTLLRAAFDATMEDADFLADAAKQNLPISPVSGARAAAIIAPLYRTAPEIVEAARAAIR